ncbi:MAG: AAA family ATPase [archaeon]|nr:AAA family ATPase [archaeon]
MAEEDINQKANDFIFEKLIKYFNITENVDVMREKFKEGEVQTALVKLYTEPDQLLVVQPNIQSGKEKWIINQKENKKKSLLILKSNKERQLDPDLSKNFVFIELTKKALEEMYDICNDVFFPLLSQSVKNQDQSELISRELVEKFHNFLAHYYVFLGHKEGRTLLPKPSDEIIRNEEVVESEKTQVCEGAVLMWVDLIRNIVKKEPEHAFRNGENPLPSTEIKFWQNRDQTLQSILNQIGSEGINGVLEYLQKQKSTYFEMFNEIKRDVEQKAKEAHYNYVFLRVLDPYFASYEEEGSVPTELAENFIPIFHVIRKVWEDDEYYRKPERLIVLIRKICNAIIKKCSDYITPTILGKIPEDTAEEQNGRLNDIKKVIQDFMEAYFRYKDGDPNAKPAVQPEGEEGEEGQAEPQEDKGWHITRNVIFYRLDAFNDRVGDVLNVATSYSEFRKMSEKVLGGIKAEALQQTLRDIFAECTDALKEFNAPIGEGKNQRDFDALDINSEEFNNRYIIFKDNLKELERKISAVLTQSFDENETILGKFKVLDNFDTILERPYISVELEKKYNILLDMYKEELKIVQNMFLSGRKLIEEEEARKEEEKLEQELKQKDPEAYEEKMKEKAEKEKQNPSKPKKSPLNKNMPPIAAKLNWTYSLKSRIQEPIEKFKKCPKVITKEEYKEVETSYESISSMIDEYGIKAKVKWDEDAKKISEEKQKDFILTRKEDIIDVNFNPELNQLLKEVKYLKILNMEIPEEAENTFSKNVVFRKQISDLENIKSQYNNIIRHLHKVEKPMVDKKLQKVEALLKDGFDKLTWESGADIDKYTKKALDSISELSATVDKLKAFVAKLEGIFADYTKEENLLFKRPDKLQEALALKTNFVNEFDYKRGLMASKVKDIASLQEVQNALKSAIQTNMMTFKETPEWKNYQHYINSIVLKGSLDLILKNLDHLLECLDPSLDPICSVRLELRDRKIFFEPEFYGDPSGNGLSIKDMIIEWINSFLNLSTLFRVRVDTGAGDYMIEVLESFQIQEITYKLYNEISMLTKESDEKLGEFNDFKMIWESNFDESFQLFLKENTVIPEPTDDQKERAERVAKVFNENNPNPITKNITEYTPSKEIFDDKINEFKDKLKKVKNMPNNANVRWIQIDFTEFKNSLSSSIEEWIEKYKDFLRNNSKTKIENIEAFMKRVQNGILNKPTDTTSKEDKEKFYHLLENIRDMELLYPKIMELIPTIKGELAILSKHMKRENEDDPFDIEERNMDSAEQELILKTQEIEKTAPELKKQVDSLSEEINELIEKEKQNFKQEKKDFEQQLQDFRKDFMDNAPKRMTEFTLEEVQKAYESLDDYYEKTLKLEEQMKKNNDMELLLKIPLSKNQEIGDCLRDLKMIKSVWDFASLNFEIYESWQQIKISDMDIRDLCDLSEGLKSNLTNVKKDVKTSVPAYAALNQKTKDVNATMCQIQNLTEGTIIKPRHWKHLQEIIKKHIPYDSEDFKIKDFFDLEIHKFAEEVETEKGTAEGQAKMEKDYNIIDKRWQTKKFEMTQNLNKKTYPFPLFDHGEMDKIIEILETDIIKLTSMAQKKGILENFEGMADNIMNKLNLLRTVCDVTKMWLKLQKNWEKLEVIFLKSDDIQNKLRDEYTLFKEMDIKFRENLKEANDFSIMVDVCTEQRRTDIELMLKDIETCQNALDNYLGTKKKQFPRFYFVSNDTLLGMLSQADYPNLINKNVKDCFDGIKFWTMKDQDKDGRSNTVYAMCSADNGEVCELDEPFKVQGQLVEIYLGDFEKKMRETLTEILFKAHHVVDWNSAIGTGDKMKDDHTRHLWLNPFPAQIALLVTQVVWTEEVEHALEATDGGDSGALKEFYELSVKRIEHLIDRVRDEPLTKDLRAKIITVITVDVHGRDVVEAFSKMKPAIESGNFNWKKQLRFYYNPEKKQCEIKICDFITNYSYEYIGNTGRLVITPLTDRCYITLTQALNLILGGAPAGPAGTGKTETVKDLGRNMGLGVIVNNCSEQMDIETTARIFSGLSQTGFWGCFDEFNRILIEVLSVVSAQVKVVLDALRENKSTFNFQGDEISLIKTVGFFITMNPGYAGRTELPDNLKALFRSCAMVVPDLKEICQNMLMSEGFSKAKPIASKFITLYTLSKDLLSKQRHYDWGLRAIKSLLRQAGGLKRHPANKKKNEFTIIKTALYDFNKAKIVTDDIPIFEGLLGDLFKESEKSSGNEDNINAEINEKISLATECKDVNLQKDIKFTDKTRQLKEILEVRHCLFILGSPGSGKTCVWKALFYTNMNYLGEPSKYAELSPKSVTGFELFGYNDPKTKIWRYGILSSTMKKMCKNEQPYTEDLKNKWIILDGDIDPNWIESLNTVMDDNKVLTLTNGDRFPLDEFMRLIFEVSNLRNATPATVSRGGVLFIGEYDIGITPCFDKWVKDRYSSDEFTVIKRSLQEFFKPAFDRIKELRDRYVAPVVEMTLLQNFMTIYQNLMDEVVYSKDVLFKEMEDETKALIAEGIFFMAYMWGVGGGLKDKEKIMPAIVNSMIKSKNKIRIPEKEKTTCFDYFFDSKKIAWVPWLDVLSKPEIGEFELFADIIIPNVEVTRLSRITAINMIEERAVLFVGGSGTGKSAVCKYFLKKEMENLSKLKKIKDKENDIIFENCTINFNSFTESSILQANIDSNIRQRVGVQFGPEYNHKKIFFLDDLNMPQLDIFGTQSHVELLRQIIDYKFYYDRKELENVKMLNDLLFVGAQNPTAGSFVIDLRLQRHFTLLATSKPSESGVKEIYTFICLNHFNKFVFTSKADNKDEIVKGIVDCTYELLKDVSNDPHFNPSAAKFHYQWNMREVCKVVGGVLRSSPTFFKTSDMLYKLWYHEAIRVYRDRLIMEDDFKAFDTIMQKLFAVIYKGDLQKAQEDIKEPFIFVPFGDEIGDDMPEALIQFKSYDLLKKHINEAKEQYNEEKGDLPLVLFDDAIQDICRISRIISNSCSNALLVGVGGSGKQSLSRLAAFMKEMEFAMPNLTGTDYNEEEFVTDIRKVMEKAVLKQGEVPYAFLVNDNHIISETFLVYINTFLSSYWIEEMFKDPKELESLMAKNLHTGAAEYGFTKSSADTTPEALKDYLIFRVKRSVHFIICMSPVGETLRVRARKFPSILSGTSIDWFHDWPDKALIAVSSNDIGQMEQFQVEDPNNEYGEKMPGEQVIKIATIASQIHKSINEFNNLFFESERRYNYTTPKSFLELVKYFKSLVGRKMDEIDKDIARLKQGLETVEVVTKNVNELKENIAVKSVDVKASQEETAEILANLEVETKKNSKEKDIVEKAAGEAAEASANAQEQKANAEAALNEALPAMRSAEAAAKEIDPKDLDNFKKPNNPSDRNFQVFKLIYLIFNPKDKVPSDDKAKEMPLIKSKALSKTAEQIKNQMIGLLNDISWITPEFLQKVQMWREPPYSDKKEMMKVSGAVASLCEFFQNMCLFYEKFQIVKPLEETAQKATEDAARAQAKADDLNAKFEKLAAKQRQLEADLKVSMDKKEKIEAEMKALTDKLAIAEKFLYLLGDSKERWIQQSKQLEIERQNIAGDCILGSSFVSYIGVFNSFFRTRIVDKWQEIITSNDIKVTPNIDLVHSLTSEVEILKMKAEGLPADPFSEENAVIITQCTRYPLIIDPQMQAIGWLKNRSDKKVLVQYKQKSWDTIIGEALGTGEPIIIEDVDQEIDPLLQPIMGKQTTNKDKGGSGGKNAMIRVGNSDYPFNVNTPIYFITKISNPHYKPEIVAQCTLINFIVTEKGLEDQLLALVVNIEKPDLEENIRTFVNENNKLQADLLAREADVLNKLTSADSQTILDNIPLLNSLEETKVSSEQIMESKRKTEELIKEINIKREIYRPVGLEGSMLFFLIGKLFIIKYMYQYSLTSFQYFFEKAIAETEKVENPQLRVQKLREKIRMTVYVWISAGMFEADKKLLLTLISIRLLQKNSLTHESLAGVGNKHIQFLLKCPGKSGTDNAFKGLLPDNNWDSLVYMSDLEGLQGFAEKIEKEYNNKFREWYNEIAPEDVDLPVEYKKYKKHSFHKILILRACRKERVGIALNEFIRVCLPEGDEFLRPRTFTENLQNSFEDSRPETPLFFILSPGSNPISDLQILGREVLPKKIKKKFEYGKNFTDIPMGQGSEGKAEEAMKNCNANGEWLILQNIHLMPKWLSSLEDKLKEISKEKGHEDFRLFLSAEPSDKIPVGILEKCIKFTNEPPSGLKENMCIAFNTLKNNKDVSFNDEKRRCGVIFGLCYYHAVVIERKKFGSLGWNRNYPFSLDDLRNSDAIVGRYIEPGVSRIPWEDLKYIVGEIMYGGHIVDDLDRVLNNAYLNYILDDKLLVDLDLVPYPSNSAAMKVNPIKVPMELTNTFAFENVRIYLIN